RFSSASSHQCTVHKHKPKVRVLDRQAPTFSQTTMSFLQNPSMSTDAWWCPQDSSTLHDPFTEAFFASQPNADLPSLSDAGDSCGIDSLSAMHNTFVVDDGDYSTSSDFLLEANLGLSLPLLIAVDTPPASTFPFTGTGQLPASAPAKNATAKARASSEPRQSLDAPSDAPSPVEGRVQNGKQSHGAVDAGVALDNRGTDAAASSDASSPPNTPASMPSDDDTLVGDDEGCSDPPSPAETLFDTPSPVEPSLPVLPTKRLPKRSKGVKDTAHPSPPKAGPSRLPPKASSKKKIDYESDASFESDAAGCDSDSDGDYAPVKNGKRKRAVTSAGPKSKRQALSDDEAEMDDEAPLAPLRIVLGLAVQCPHCPHTTRTPNGMSRHLKRHQPSKPRARKCQACGTLLLNGARSDLFQKHLDSCNGAMSEEIPAKDKGKKRKISKH
ncbi:hypothetical protein C8R43DRAFT_1177766, partial [Mycena crocata]